MSINKENMQVAHAVGDGVRIFRPDKHETYEYMVYVTPGHAQRFADAINLAVKELLEKQGGK